MAASVFALRLSGGGWNDYRESLNPGTAYAFGTPAGIATLTYTFEPILTDESVGWEDWDVWEDWDPSIFPIALGATSGPGDADPRALGEVTEVWATGEPVASTAEPVVFIVRRSTRVENDGGAWVGRATVTSIGNGPVGTSFWELVGEGGYTGLTLFLWGDYVDHPHELLGMIIPSDNVPDFQPLPHVGAE